MGVFLARCGALGTPTATRPGNAYFAYNNSSYSPQDLTRFENLNFFSETATPWIRLWADWPSLEPAQNVFNHPWWLSLDDQLRHAKSKGLAVMLTAYRFPTWVGYDQLSPAEKAESAKDRGSNPPTPDSPGKGPEFRIPLDVSPTSYWAFFIYLLAYRYNPVLKPLPPQRRLINPFTNPPQYSTDANDPVLPSPTVDALEICNEANSQWWPQVTPATASTRFGEIGSDSGYAHRYAARMMATARGVIDGLNTQRRPLLVGPALSDIRETNRVTTECFSFAQRTLDHAVAAYSYRGDEAFVWSHHNYDDVTYDIGLGSNYPDDPNRPGVSTIRPFENRAQRMRQLLVDRGWQGWPGLGQPVTPYLWLTEGAVVRQRLIDRWKLESPYATNSEAEFQRRYQVIDQLHADLIQRAWNRMRTDGAGSYGIGIGMFSNYLVYTDPGFDSGLRNPATINEGFGGAIRPAGARRPAHATWAGLRV